jgi:hypothetical protein
MWDTYNAPKRCEKRLKQLNVWESVDSKWICTGQEDDSVAVCYGDSGVCLVQAM